MIFVALPTTQELHNPEFSPKYEVVHTMLDANYDRYLNFHQDINIGLLKHMAAIGADLALPDGSRSTDVAQEFASRIREDGRIKQAT